MQGEFISVGTELLLGDILNTNAQYLSKACARVDIPIYFQSTVGDNRERMESTIKTAISRSDIVLITGGLGPTYDDITKEVVADIMEEPLVLDAASMKRIEGFFERTGQVLTKNNERQAVVFKNGKILANPVGLAPGLWLEKWEKIIILLPGPPMEMQAVFENEVEPRLKELTQKVIKSEYLHFFGIGESRLEDRLKDLMLKSFNPTIAPYAKGDEVVLRVSAEARNDEEADQLIAEIIEKIKCECPEHEFVKGDEPLSKQVSELLRAQGKTVALAESCTGGFLAADFTQWPGASDIFLGSVCSYAISAKENLLGVESETIERYNVVSEEVAIAMAEGARKAFGSDYALATTGVAGPTGFSEEHPVGQVWFGFSSAKGSFAKKFQAPAILQKSRIKIQKAAVKRILYEFLLWIKEEADG